MTRCKHVALNWLWLNTARRSVPKESLPILCKNCFDSMSFFFYLPFRSDAGQRATAASSAEVAEDAVSQTNDLNPERHRTQHSRRRRSHDDDDDGDDVARGVRLRHRAGHSRERR